MRTGQQQDTNANAAGSTAASGALNAETGDINQFNQNEATLEKGGNVAADPWLTPGYLSNQGRLTSDVLNSNQNAGAAQLRQLNRRTGGLNTGATQSAISGLRLNTGRLGNQLTAQQAQQDFGKNVSYQQYLAGLPLQAAGAEQSIYGQSLGEVNAADNNLTQLGTASYGPWNALIQGIGGAAQGALTGGFGKGGAFNPGSPSSG